MTLRSRTTDASWTEWHGSGGWADFSSGINHEYRTIGKLWNKRHYDAGWSYYPLNDKFIIAYHRKKIWDVGRTETNIGSFFSYRNDDPYIRLITMHKYDEHGNYVDMYEEEHLIPEVRVTSG